MPIWEALRLCPEGLYVNRSVLGRLAVWVAYWDGRVSEGRTGLAAPSDRFDVLLDAPRGATQMGLFDVADVRAEEVARLKREVNRRSRRFVLRSAATLPLVEVYRDPSNAFDICDVLLTAEVTDWP